MRLVGSMVLALVLMSSSVTAQGVLWNAANALADDVG